MSQSPDTDRKLRSKAAEQHLQKANQHFTNSEHHANKLSTLPRVAGGVALFGLALIGTDVAATMIQTHDWGAALWGIGCLTPFVVGGGTIYLAGKAFAHTTGAIRGTVEGGTHVVRSIGEETVHTYKEARRGLGQRIRAKKSK